MTIMAQPVNRGFVDPRTYNGADAETHYDWVHTVFLLRGSTVRVAADFRRKYYCLRTDFYYLSSA